MRIKADDTTAIEELLNNCKQRAFVVEGAIEQAPEIAAINPSSINTIRAFTLIKRDGTTQIISILLRVGMPGMVVDNWGSGAFVITLIFKQASAIGQVWIKSNNRI